MISKETLQCFGELASLCTEKKITTMASTSQETVRPNVPTPDTFSREPYEVHKWLFGVELYFTVFWLDLNGADAEYCAQLAASLLQSNALKWHHLASMRNPATAHDTYTVLKSATEAQFAVINKQINA